MAILLLIGVFSSNSLNASIDIDSTQHVLILHSYNKGLKWTDSEDAGIQTALAKSSNTLQIHTEYLNTKFNSDTTYFNVFANSIKKEYSSLQFSVIIATDDDALNFYIHYHNELFPKIPLVFCGVNYLKDLKSLGLDTMVTGVIESFDIPQTLDIALKLQPRTKQIVVINDKSTTGAANLKILNKVMPDYADKVNFKMEGDLSMPKLLEYVKGLSDSDIILLLTYNIDSEGNIFSYEKSIQLISSKASIPIYGVWDFYLGSGIVGGMLTSGINQGKEAGLLALKVLKGIPVKEIPIITKSPNHYMFDNDKLKAFNLDKDEIPNGSIIINEPPSFYALNKTLLYSILGGILLLFFIILLLIKNLQTQKESALALRESEERFELAMSAVHDGIWDWDIEKNKVYYDSRYYTMAGYEPFEFPQHFSEWIKRIHPEDIRYAQGKINELISGKITQLNIEYRFLRKDGNYMWFRGRGNIAQYLANGQPKRMIGTHSDINDRRIAEEKLNESLLRWRSYIDYAPFAIFIFDSTSKCLDINPMAKILMGYSEKELLEMKLLDFIAEQDKDLGIIHFNTLMQQGNAKAELRIITKNNEQRWWYIATKYISENEYIAICEDISWRKTLELEIIHHKENLERLVKERTEELASTVEELKATNEKMQSANIELVTQRVELESTLNKLKETQEQLIHSEKMASLGILSAGVAHEINNPINYISNGIIAIEDMIKERCKNEFTELLPFFNAIRVGTDKVTEIVKSMNTYSRADLLKPTLINLHEVIENTLNILSGEIHQRIYVDRLFQLENPVILANEGQMHQVFLNLLLNASQAIEDDGIITIETFKSGDNIVIEVSDTGKGIPEKNLKHIFDPFFTTKDPGKGTGLGLSLVQKIVHEHGGTVICRSVIEKGTTVVLNLPILITS